jgi:hypothetical protein
VSAGVRPLPNEAPAGVQVVSRPLWRLRLARALPRYLMYVLCAAGLAASARFAIAPPRPHVKAVADGGFVSRDRAAEGFACLFTRRYLTWDGSQPYASEGSIERFAGAGMEPGIGLRPPPRGEQHVEWAEVVQERQPTPAERVYTVAAQTDTAGTLYLSVSVVRGEDGSLGLAGYPAFVGAPAYGPAHPSSTLRAVTDVQLQIVVTRALRNYLAGSQSNLAADLSRAARVSLPPLALEAESVAQLRWAPGGGSVLAVLQAHDRRGVSYTLQYEVDVVRVDGRWGVAAVQMRPDA